MPKKQQLPPPTSEERERAALSAEAIRAALADPAQAGQRSTMHVNTGRRRAHLWISTWANLPGLMLDAPSRTFTHELLPGWEYTPREMKGEMLEDLDRLAQLGERPAQATRR